MNDTTQWVHPTGNSPTRVVVVGLGPTKHDLMEEQTGKHANPLAMEADEYWGVNSGLQWFGTRVAWDVLFVMDYLYWEATREPGYGRRLREWAARHGAPIVTSRAGPAFPEAVEYPLQLIDQAAGRRNDAPLYLHNSIPYVLAYAWFIGVQEVVLAGVDYSHDGLQRREDDRACAEYWIGWCRAHGMTVTPFSETHLLNTDKQPWFYGHPPHHQPRLAGARVAALPPLTFTPEEA